MHQHDPFRAVYQRLSAGTLPVSTEEARSHLKLETQADDNLVNAFLFGATDLVEDHTGRAVREGQWQILIDCFGNPIPIELHPVKQIDSITHIVAGSPVTVSTALYYLVQRPQGAEIRLTVDSDWPDDTDERKQAITVTITTAKLEEYVQTARRGILQLVAYLYENRGDVDLADPDLLARSGARRLLDTMTIARI